MSSRGNRIAIHDGNLNNVNVVRKVVDQLADEASEQCGSFRKVIRQDLR
jgi:hypothetical protein